MSDVESITDKLKDKIQEAFEQLKSQVLGANNERLDFVMDSFYKLEPKHRILVIIGLVASAVLFLVLSFMLYFSQVNKLTSNLSNVFSAIHEIENIVKEKSSVDKQYKKLTGTIERKMTNLRMKPFFEKLANTYQVSIDRLSEKKIENDDLDESLTKLQQVHVSLRLPKISIPKLLKFITEAERANIYIRVKDLKVKGLYGTKLYFDAEVKFRGYYVE